MSFPNRETIVLASAIVGATLPGILTVPKPVQSFDCGQPFQAVADNVSHTLNQQVEPAKGEPIGSYYDVRQKRDVPFYREGEAPVVKAQADVYPAAMADATVPTAAPPIAVAPSPTPRNEGAAIPPDVDPLSLTDAELDVAIARQRASQQGGY